MLIQSRCPFAGDSHRSVVLPVVSSKKQTYPSLRKRFVVKMFSFVKPPTFENQVRKRKKMIYPWYFLVFMLFFFIMQNFSYRSISTVM